MFNRKENWNYNGPWPSADYYSPDEMTESDRKKFFQWYEEQTNKIFDFQKEIQEYCESDVEVSNLFFTLRFSLFKIIVSRC